MRSTRSILPILAAMTWLAAAPPPAPPATGGAPKPPGRATAPAAGAPAVRLVSQARRLSTYTLQTRFQIATADVTFDAPEAYRESFAFWTARMKGHKRMEMYEFLTVTQDFGAGGEVAFRRTLPRFNMELEKGGQPYAPYGPLQRLVTTMAWDGTFDRLGNVKEVRVVTMPDDPEIATLALPLVERIFPSLAAAHDLRPGEQISEVLSVPMPTRLNVQGLEDLRLQITRRYVLRPGATTHAMFDVEVAYAVDPATSPKAEGTFCVAGGGGKGDATFDVKRGVFLATRLPTRLTIDIEAPLRPLPGGEETAAPGKAKTHLDLDITLTGQQTVRRVWGEED